MQATLRRAVLPTATGLMLAAAALPFVVLFPEPPAFGRGTLGIVAAVAIGVAVGTSGRAGRAARHRLLRRAALLLATTGAATVLHIVLLHAAGGSLPTPDLLPLLFGLQGEEVDDAVLFEAWCELWLVCGTAAILLSRKWPSGGPVPKPAAEPGPSPPWNPATTLLCALGCAALAGAVVEGHRTAAFLARAHHVSGTVASADDHPLIRFTTGFGTVVEFRQNGSVSRPPGAAVPVAYDTRNPAGTARADTVWVNWSGVLGLLWVGLGFALFPFFGFRAAFRAGRW